MSRLRQLVICETLALVLLVGLFQPAPAQAAGMPRLTVGPGESFKTINSAIKAAQPGQTIDIKGGTYPEHVVIDKPVALVGQGDVRVDGGNRGNVILVAKTHGVSITNVTLLNSGGPGILPYAGIKIDDSRCVSVDHVVMRNIEHGVYLQQSNDCLIRDTDIAGKVQLLPEDRGDGIGFWRSAHNRVENCHVWDVRDGCKFEFSPDNRITGTTFDHLRYGIHYMYSDDNAFDHNTFSQDVAGATPMYSKHISFTNNIFFDFPGQRAFAILLMNADDCLIKDNLVMESNVGFQLDHSTNNRIEGNAVINCGVAFRVFGTSGGNLFTGNSARDNVIQVGSDYGALPNRWSAEGRGNYWSDYAGYDFTGSDLGSIPYHSVSYLAQAVYDQPMLELFAGSPGLQAVAQGMQLFPLWKLPGIQDDHPLMRQPELKREWLSWLRDPEPLKTRLFFALLSFASTLIGLGFFLAGRRRRPLNVANR
ncbi:Pectin lyase fold/virulence factor [Acididesulfobacillus acetoxydans]|uniref:Parallel beta-helix repeat (Two copies) n=1 Tax=Acididesulfobacillus acetoxydans TaxID=1561005 RepID=A0A8S0WLL6_9FIRM|nr:nitrous oxide reductase family maturation protein NosD [Acididesulfobacillus acetoxydans]CAA7600064.1 Pectin lyase fold/virulence factor [Acididesulfobacillus acetoxydans]CEJ07839.1 Parallel beta-helix repeat (Two copies) [Acididesulfobacillus acetoxydans]